jgi:hypothetical protein
MVSKNNAVLKNPVRSKKITVDVVHAALLEVVEEEPERRDRRAEDGLCARYMDQGQPNCLVAKVLLRLGYSTGVLRQLDREFPTGELCHAGVRVVESRHPALRRIEPAALKLLQYVQDQQDRGHEWGAIVGDAFRRNRFFSDRWYRERKPWLFA